MTDRHAHIAALTLVPVVALALSLGFLAGDRYRTLRCEGPQLAERVGASATFHDGTNSGTNQ